MPWNPDRYAQFKAQRSQPFYDLAAYLEARPGLSLIDLGCGTGELTRELADRLPDCQALGVDNSPEMLAKSAAYARPGLRFQLGAIQEQAAAAQWEVVFSNAAIQWVPDHPRLIPHLLAMVKPGGQLLIQQPANHQQAPHTLIQALAQEAPFGDFLAGRSRQSPVLSLESYGQILHQAGAVDLILLDKVYPHLLPDAAAVLDWVRGTALLPYLEALPAELGALFQDRLLEKLQAYYGLGEAFFPFRRMFLIARRPA
jgi:trans-aconitate 2-methyltransferase